MLAGAAGLFQEEELKERKVRWAGSVFWLVRLVFSLGTDHESTENELRSQYGDRGTLNRTFGGIYSANQTR